MVDQIIRPADLPNRASPVASEKIPVDNGVTVGGATIQSIVESGRPAASQSEAEAGINAEKAMTPLTSRQGLLSQIGVTIASKAQGDRADSAVQPADLATVATTGSYNDLTDKPTLSDETSAESRAWAISNLHPISAPTFIRTAGYDAPGDGGDALYKLVVSEPSHAGKFSITLDDGVTLAWYEIDAVAASYRAPRRWQASWFGLIDSPTVDQTAVVQSIIDAYDPADGAIEVEFPSGQVVLNGGESDNPVLINKHGVSLKLSRDTILKKTVQDRLLIIVGSEGAVTEGNRIQDFSLEGGTIDGGSIIDTSDDYACVNLKYVDGGVVRGLKIRDASNGVRVGWSSQASWSLANRRSKNTRIYDCEMQNMRWFGIEVHGAENTMIRGNRVTGGAISDFNDNVGIRLVRFLRADVDGNIIDGAGRGIGTSTISGEDNMYANFRGNIVTAPTYGECFSLSGPHRWVNVIGNQFYGAGNDGTPNVATISAGGLGTLSDLIFADNYLTATRDNIAALLRLNEVSGSDVNGNKFRSIGVWSSGTKRCLLATGCLGLLSVVGNTFDYDYSAGYGFEDSGGASSLRAALNANVFRGVNANINKTKAIRQVSSSGTLVYSSNGDTNSYIDA